MQKIEILALLSDSKRLIELLQRRGIVELTDCADPRLVNINTSSGIAVFEKNKTALVQALALCDEYAPQKVGLLASFTTPKREYETHAFGKKIREMEQVLKQAYDMLDFAGQIADAKAEIARLTVLKDSLSAWENYDLPLDFSGTSSTRAFLGTLPGFCDQQSVEALLGEKSLVKILGATKVQTNLFVLCHRSVMAETENILRENGFMPFSENIAQTPAMCMANSEEEIRRNEQRITEAAEAIRAFASYRQDFEFFIDYLDIRKDKYAALNKVGMTEQVFVVSGFIPEKYAGKLAEELEKRFDCVVSLSEVSEEDDVPVLLENNRFAAPVEGITEMYALPGKKDIDPSPVMAFFYYLFFGMMLSDAGYGILMVIGTAIALAKFSLSESMKKTMRMFLYCGISTIFWGAMFGSWFGDIVKVVGREFFHKEIGSLALWFEPLDDPMKLLLFSFLLGILHLFLGLITNFCILWKRGQRWDAVFDVIPVMLTVAGVAPLAAGILVTGIPSVVKTVGTVMAIVGVATIVLTAGRASKSIPMRFFGGIYGLYNTATGYLSDILSYSRLLALGLATGSIAGVINLIGVMPSQPVIKAVMLVIVFVVGHTANLAINLLGAYVHTDRLQFVELFSKFYEGGGRAFEPLRIKTNYITVKEENKNE